MKYDAIKEWLENRPWWTYWIQIYWNYAWVTVWSSKNLEVTLGVGQSFKATTNKIFSVREHRFLCFWAYITRPTIGFINKAIK